MSDEYTITTRSEGLLGKIGQWGAALITDEEMLEALAAHDAEVRAGVVAEEWIAYGRGVSGEFMIPEPKGPNYATHQRTIKAGPWVPVEN